MVNILQKKNSDLVVVNILFRQVHIILHNIAQLTNEVELSVCKILVNLVTKLHLSKL